MNKDNYNIDDILSEVKKRREEAPEDSNQATPKSEADLKDDNSPVSEEPEEEAAQEDIAAEEESSNEAEPETEPKETSDADFEEEMVDILSLSEEDAAQETEAPAEEEPNTEESDEIQDALLLKKKKRRKRAKIILGVIAIIIITSIVAAVISVNNMLNVLMSNNASTVATTEKPWQGMDSDDKSFEPIDETEANQLSSYKDMVKEWYYNGKPCYNDHVLNVLLMGVDTRDDEIPEGGEGTRADSAIIVSVNIDTGIITLTSILRDAYGYWETTEGDESTGRFGKINGALATGGVNAYINCIENLYKIRIDNYAIVNFKSFEAIVDTLGGVTLEIKEKEINEINNHQKRYGNVTIEKDFEGSSGKMKLNGEQALAYCRIRKIDSDDMRADRQKTCLLEIFKQTKDASTVKLIKIIKKLIPYVTTGFSKNEILKIAKYAFSKGWLNYKTYMQTLPEYNVWGGTAYGEWIWKCDFPADAYNLQYIIYGQSNITLAHYRVDIEYCPENGFYSEGDNAMTNYITNPNYGEVTTVTTTTKNSNQ